MAFPILVFGSENCAFITVGNKGRGGEEFGIFEMVFPQSSYMIGNN